MQVLLELWFLRVKLDRGKAGSPCRLVAVVSCFAQRSLYGPTLNYFLSIFTCLNHWKKSLFYRELFLNTIDRDLHTKIMTSLILLILSISVSLSVDL